MNRRSIMMGMGAAAATLPLTGTLFAAKDKMGDAEKQHAMRTRETGSLSLLSSRAALTKASSPKVVEFANFEVAEQETIGDILKGEMNPSMPPSGQVVAPTDAEAMQALTPDDKATLDKLSSLSGKEFETAFVTGQIDAHQKLLTYQTDYLNVGKSRDNLNVAKLAKGQITEHLKLLSDIQSSMA